jgi:hypothetical protein
MLDIKQMCSELQTEIGIHAKYLYIQYLMAENAKDKNEIKAKIEILHSQKLKQGIQENSLLLPPPKTAKAQGSYILGNVLYNDKELYPFGLRESEINRHININSMSGGGKTNLINIIIKQILKHNKKFMLFDNKSGIFRHLKKNNVLFFTPGQNTSPLNINIIQKPDGIETDEWIEYMTDLISFSFFGSYGFRSILKSGLQAIFKKNSNPTMLDFKIWLEKQPRSGRKQLWMDSVKRAVDALTEGLIGEQFNKTSSIRILDLLQTNVVFEMGSIGKELQTFFCEFITLHIFIYRKKNTPNSTFQHALIFDEPHNVIKESENKEIESLLLKSAREFRQYGEGIVTAFQHPSLLPREIFGNSYTTICLNLKIKQDVTAGANAMLLPKDKEQYLGKLPVGTAIVKLSGRYMEPFLIKIPEVKINNEIISDEQITAYMQSQKAQIISNNKNSSELQTYRSRPTPQTFSQCQPNTAQVSSAADKKENPLSNLTKEHTKELIKKLLLDILQYPFSGCNTRYKKLGLTNKKGPVLKEKLIELGIIMQTEIKHKNGHTFMLELTEQGLQLMKKEGTVSTKDTNNRHGSIEHRYWIDRIYSHYKSKVDFIQKEYPIGEGKTADIYLIYKGKNIIFEVETGKSNIKANIEKTKTINPDKIILVPTNEKAKNKITKLLCELPDQTHSVIMQDWKKY